MFYEVRAHLFFTEADEARDFVHDCELAFERSSVVNPGQVNEECGVVDLLSNHHDADPNSPCEVLRHTDNSTF